MISSDRLVEAGRNRRHPDHIEIADLEKFGDQEGGGSQHRRRQDRAQAAGRQQSAGGVFSKPALASIG